MERNIERQPRKRAVQRQFTKLLPKQKGTILGLSGPRPIDAVKVYLENQVGNWFTLFEIDPKIYRKIGYRPPIVVLQQNILSYLINQTDTDVIGLDLDFCKGLPPGKAYKLGKILLEFATRSELKRFFVRVTSCPRGVGKDRIFAGLRLITQILETQYDISNPVATSYRDTATMHCAQFICTKGDKREESKETQ